MTISRVKQNMVTVNNINNKRIILKIKLKKTLISEDKGGQRSCCVMRMSQVRDVCIDVKT